jgi:hypothetical protein
MQLSDTAASSAHCTSTSPTPMASPKVQLLAPPPPRIAIFWSQQPHSATGMAALRAGGRHRPWPRRGPTEVVSDGTETLAGDLDVEPQGSSGLAWSPSTVASCQQLQPRRPRTGRWRLTRRTTKGEQRPCSTVLPWRREGTHFWLASLLRGKKNIPLLHCLLERFSGEAK